MYEHTDFEAVIYVYTTRHIQLLVNIRPVVRIKRTSASPAPAIEPGIHYT